MNENTEIMGNENTGFTNNNVEIIGKINSNLEFSHEVFGERFYIFNLTCKRLSETEDQIPIIVSNKLESFNELTQGKYVYIKGNFRSYNENKDGKSRLILNVFVRELDILIDTEEKTSEEGFNNIFLEGFICKKPVYRETPLGKEIADFILAVNRPYGKSDYIPCIVWNENARKVRDFKVGDEIKITGRVQSREYTKKISEKQTEKRIAYEVSCWFLEKKE